jgi:hypothetical protein
MRRMGGGGGGRGWSVRLGEGRLQEGRKAGKGKKECNTYVPRLRSTQGVSAVHPLRKAGVPANLLDSLELNPRDVGSRRRERRRSRSDPLDGDTSGAGVGAGRVGEFEVRELDGAALGGL